MKILNGDKLNGTLILHLSIGKEEKRVYRERLRLLEYIKLFDFLLITK